MKKKNLRILQFNAVFQEEDDGGFSVWVPNLPGCCSQGDSFEEAFKNIREAIDLYLEEVPAEEKEESEDSAKQFLVPVRISSYA